MRISVFGIGYVGAVSAACAARDGFDVVAVDISSAKVDIINAGGSPISEPGLDVVIAGARASGRLRATTSAADAISQTELSLICVGTPSQGNGAIDLSAVKRVAAEIGAELARKTDRHCVVLRSTTLPGTTETVLIPALEEASGKTAGRDFGVAYYPEFLREGAALRDYDEPGCVIIGVLDEATAQATAGLAPKSASDAMFVPIAVAEAAKYVNNAWHALKISFANEVGNISKAFGVDGREVMEILCSDHRLNISAAYMRPGFAFGGSCLPKDVRALRHQARRLDLDTPLLDGVMSANEAQFAAAYRLIEEAGGRKVGLIGLSFKPGTDDLRESPMVVLAERLLGRGFEVTIFDENVRLSRLTGANLAHIRERLPHIGRMLCERLEDVVAASETLVVFHAPLAKMLDAASLESKTVIDLTGVPALALLPGYRGICW